MIEKHTAVLWVGVSFPRFDILMSHLSYLHLVFQCLLHYLNTFEVGPARILCHISPMIILTALPAVGVFLDMDVGCRIRDELEF